MTSCVAFFAFLLFFILRSQYCCCLSKLFSNVSISKTKPVQQDSGTHHAYGCVFKNKKFDLNQENIYDVQFGNKTVANSFMPIPHGESFESIKQKLWNINQDVMTGSEYNFFDEFLEFFLSYNPTHNVDLRNYLEYQYEVPASQSRHGHGRAMQILNRLKKDLPHAVPYSHLATVYTNVLQEDLKKLQDYDIRFPFPKFFHHDIIVAVVRVLDERGKKWFLVADPLRGVSDIVAIPVNTLPVGDSAYLPDIGRTLYFGKIQSSHQSYVLGETTDDDKNIYRDVYYLHLPYCSFLKTTAKLRLLNPVGSIIKRNENGVVTAKIAFNLLTSRDDFSLFYKIGKEVDLDILPLSCIPTCGGDLDVQPNLGNARYNQLFRTTVQYGLKVNQQSAVDGLCHVILMLNTEYNFLARLEKLRNQIYQEREAGSSRY